MSTTLLASEVSRTLDEASCYTKANGWGGGNLGSYVIAMRLACTMDSVPRWRLLILSQTKNLKMPSESF